MMMHTSTIMEGGGGGTDAVTRDHIFNRVPPVIKHHPDNKCTLGRIIPKSSLL